MDCVEGVRTFSSTCNYIGVLFLLFISFLKIHQFLFDFFFANDLYKAILIAIVLAQAFILSQSLVLQRRITSNYFIYL